MNGWCGALKASSHRDNVENGSVFPVGHWPELTSDLWPLWDCNRQPLHLHGRSAMRLGLDLDSRGKLDWAGNNPDSLTCDWFRTSRQPILGQWDSKRGWLEGLWKFWEGADGQVAPDSCLRNREDPGEGWSWVWRAERKGRKRLVPDELLVHPASCPLLISRTCASEVSCFCSHFELDFLSPAAGSKADPCEAK